MLVVSFHHLGATNEDQAVSVLVRVDYLALGTCNHLPDRGFLERIDGIEMCDGRGLGKTIPLYEINTEFVESPERRCRKRSTPADTDPVGVERESLEQELEPMLSHVEAKRSLEPPRDAHKAPYGSVYKPAFLFQPSHNSSIHLVEEHWNAEEHGYLSFLQILEHLRYNKFLAEYHGCPNTHSFKKYRKERIGMVYRQNCIEHVCLENIHVCL